MGSIMSMVSSSLGWGGAKFDVTPDPETGLSEYDRELIKGSWAVIADKKSRRTNGTELFIHLFQEYPYQREYFPWCKDLTDDQLRKLPKMKAHALNVMYAIGAYVDVMDDAESLVGLVGRMAETHVPRGVTHTYFQDLGNMYMKTFLPSCLGPAATEEVKKAWGKLLAALVMVVKKMEKEMGGED